MVSYTIRETVYRNDDPIDIEICGEFDGDDLVCVTIDNGPDGLELTESEMDSARERLYNERTNDWDENKWESNR